MRKLFTLLAGLGMLLSIDAMAQYPLKTIDSLQFKPLDSLLIGRTLSPRVGDTVRVRGVVMFDPRFSVLRTSAKITYLQDTSAGSWRGIAIQCANTDTNATNFFNNVQVGNRVEVTGVVGEFSGATAPWTGETQLNLIARPTQALGIVSPPAPKVVSISDFSKLEYDTASASMIQKTQVVTGEPYEGMYVEFRRPTIVNVSTFSGGSRVNWSLRDSLGNEIVVRDASAFFRAPFLSSTANTPPNPNAPVFVQQGKKFAYVRGVITETNFATGASTGVRYMLIPLDTNDLGPVLAIPPFIDSISNMPMVPNDNQSVTIDAKITDDGSVASATLYYAVGYSNMNYTAVPMIAGTNSRYTATIPAQANGSFVKYYIRAVDNDGSFYSSQDSLNVRSVYKVINGGITRISDIQVSPFQDGASIYEGKTLTGLGIRATIYASAQSNDFSSVVLQQRNTPFSGIIAFPGLNNDLDTRLRGDSMLITAARIVETNSVTQLQDVTATWISSGNVLVNPIAVPFDSIRLNRATYLEQFESMIVRLDTCYAINLNPNAPQNFNRFIVNPDSTSLVGVRIEDESNDIPANFNIDSLVLKQKFNFIKGVLGFSFGNWRILPRNRGDIQGFSTSGTFINVKNVEGSATLAVYPNPAKSELNIRFETKGQRSTIRIFDLTGKKLMEMPVQGQGIVNESFNIEGLNDGLYILSLQTVEGLSNSRLVIKH